MSKSSPKSLEADLQTDLENETGSHGEVKIWVDSVVTKTDDPSTPAFTIRAVFQGIIWACFLAIANALFSFRANPFVVPTQLALLLSYPIGIFMEKVLPDINILGAPLNPGPFTVKEHALIYIIAGSAGGTCQISICDLIENYHRKSLWNRQCCDSKVQNVHEQYHNYLLE